MPPRSFRRDWLALWILGSAWCAVSGWVLSALGHLDRAGYAVSLAFFGVGLVLLRRGWENPSARPLFLARRSTYARLLPKLWLLLALLALAGGLFYYPDNYDYLTYRFPRVLSWWWAHRWHWIPLVDERQNTSAAGMEWLMAPLFVFFRTDRLFFLINFVSFLFLPGLVFSVFRRLGIGGRVAWWWMWVFPAGFCFVLQAASMGNDSFAAVYLLAALYYAYRADARSPQALILSLLAIALVTGAKASNIPLVLPWLAVLWLRRDAVRAAVRPLPLAAGCVAAAFCSFLPNALANIHFTGSYTGDPANHRYLQVRDPWAGVVGNVVEIGSYNLLPPVWPHEIHWPFEKAWIRVLQPNYPRFGFTTTPLAIEEVAGVGLGITAFSLLGSLDGLRALLLSRRRPGRASFLLVAAIGMAGLAYMAKMGSEAAPRLVAAYYPVGIAAFLLLLPPDGRIGHRRWWRATAYAAMIMAVLLLVLNPSRPLLPARWIVGGLRLLHPPASAVAQLAANYRLRALRRDGLAPLRAAIPPAETIIGCLSGDDNPVISLWLPFGSRQVVEVMPGAARPEAQGIRYVVVDGAFLRARYHLAPEDLFGPGSATVVQREDISFQGNHTHREWCLLRLTGS